MGRTPSRNKNLPAGMRARHRGKFGTYYYLDTGNLPRKEISLGKDYVLAVQKWAELTSARPMGDLVTFRYAAERYMSDILPSKAPATQKDNLRELNQLYKFFDDPPAPLETIDPVHVRQYLDFRSSAKVRANREKALLSHIWNYAREHGLTNRENPCRGVKGYKESGRDVYVDDKIYELVLKHAELPLKDAIELAYLTGQRPADVLKCARSDIKDGELWVTQDKTGARLRIKVEGTLADLIKRISSRKVMSLSLINALNGSPMTKSMLRGAFDRARDAAVIAHPELESQIREYQFRDLRAKAGTDKEESDGMAAAKDQLGHTSETMTAHYVRHRKGKLVTPTK
jgi:integrase